MALTESQYAIIRGNIGIQTDPLEPDYDAVFTNAELDGFYAAENTVNGTTASGIRALLIHAAKRNSYTVGQTKEEAKQVFDNLYKLATYYDGRADDEEAASTHQYAARFVPMKSVPTLTRNIPGNEYFGRAWNRKGYRNG